MKKKYNKPALICEELQPETLLCGCALKNAEFNEEWHCGYTLKGGDSFFGQETRIFASGWTDCASSIDNYYCYHAGQVNVFGS